MIGNDSSSSYHLPTGYGLVSQLAGEAAEVSVVGTILSLCPEYPAQGMCPEYPHSAWNILMPGRSMEDLRDPAVVSDIRKSFYRLVFKAHTDKVAREDKATYPDRWRAAHLILNVARDVLLHCTDENNIDSCLSNNKVTYTKRLKG